MVDAPPSSDAVPIERLRRLCALLPETEEKEAWGEPTFRVRRRMFAMFASATNHHGAGRDAVWIAAPLGVQEHLVANSPDTYFIPPYVGGKGWVGVWLDHISDRDLAEHIRAGYAMIAPKKLARLVDAPF